MPQAEKDPRVLAYEKPVRFGRSSSPVAQQVMRLLRPVETTTRTQGSFIEPREVNSLNVMS